MYIQVYRTTEALPAPPPNDLHFCDFRPLDPSTPGAGLLVCHPLGATLGKVRCFVTSCSIHLARTRSTSPRITYAVQTYLIRAVSNQVLRPTLSLLTVSCLSIPYSLDLNWAQTWVLVLIGGRWTWTQRARTDAPCRACGGPLVFNFHYSSLCRVGSRESWR